VVTADRRCILAAAHRDGCVHRWLSLGTIEGRIEMMICNNGAGSNPDGAPSGWLGIGAMRERAASIGAVLTVVSFPGRALV
jgi:signal transduction histidine kinase